MKIATTLDSFFHGRPVGGGLKVRMTDKRQEQVALLVLSFRLHVAQPLTPHACAYLSPNPIRRWLLLAVLTVRTGTTRCCSCCRACCRLWIRGERFRTRKSHANGHSSSGGNSNSNSAARKKAADSNGHACAVSDKPPSSPSPAHGNSHHHPTSRWTWVGYFLLLAITKYTLPDELHTSNPTLRHVWFYGWVTALSTGVGAAPLFFFPDLGKAMLALGNAVAAGMMLSASCSLVWEGATVSEPEGFAGEWWPTLAAVLAAPGARVMVGVLTGLAFIFFTKKVGVCVGGVCWARLVGMLVLCCCGGVMLLYACTGACCRSDAWEIRIDVHTLSHYKDAC